MSVSSSQDMSCAHHVRAKLELTQSPESDDPLEPLDDPLLDFEPDPLLPDLPEDEELDHPEEEELSPQPPQ